MYFRRTCLQKPVALNVRSGSVDIVVFYVAILAIIRSRLAVDGSIYARNAGIDRSRLRSRACTMTKSHGVRVRSQRKTRA